MHPDMLVLAERLVVAMERMSEDVKNISSHVYDLSYNVSCFLNDKRGNEDFLQLAHDDSVNLPSGSRENVPEASAESQRSLQNDHGDRSSVPSAHDSENRKTSAQGFASLAVENLDVLPPFSETIKTEEQSEDEENDESLDLCCTYRDEGNNLRDSLHVSKEMKPRRQSENDGEDHSYATHTMITNSIEQLHPSESLDRNEFDSAPVPGGTQGVEPSSISLFNSGCTRHTTRLPEGESLVAKTSNVMCVQSFTSTDKYFCCIICKKTFFTKRNLIHHKRVHFDEVRYKCSLCGKTFQKSSSLHAHVLLHSGEKPFMCNVCGKAFSQKSNLTIHKRVHTGEKPYMCTVCGKGFPQSNKLTNHMRVHTGERSFACDHCGSRFTESGSLRRHRLAIHEDASPVHFDNEYPRYPQHVSLRSRI